MRGKLAKPCQPGALEYSCDKGKSDLFFNADYGNLRNVSVLAVMTDDGSIAKMEIEAPKNSVIELAGYLEDKYGSPNKENSQEENGLGKKFDKETYVWIDKKGNRIILQSIYNDINTGHVEIVAAEMFAAQQIGNKEESEANKKKL